MMTTYQLFFWMARIVSWPSVQSMVRLPRKPQKSRSGSATVVAPGSIGEKTISSFFERACPGLSLTRFFVVFFHVFCYISWVAMCMKLLVPTKKVSPGHAIFIVVTNIVLLAPRRELLGTLHFAATPERRQNARIAQLVEQTTDTR